MPRAYNIAVLLCLLFTGSALTAFSQKDVKKTIQFSGIVFSSGDKDSLQAVPFVNIIVKGSHKGTITDFVGFFCLPVEVRDTVEFSAIGFKKSRVIIPDTIKGTKYSQMRVLAGDTVMLRAAVIRPWPSIQQFKTVFMAKKVPDDDLERARKNLLHAEMAMKYVVIQDGGLSYKNVAQQHSDRMYYAGQLVPNRLLDPIAWSKLIDAWRKGELKIQTAEPGQN